MADNKATLTISFDEGADSSLLATAFLDDELNKDGAGETKTSFSLTDRPWFLVHLDPKLAIKSVLCSSGTVRTNGIQNRTAEEDIDVADDVEESELNYYPSGNITGTWYGNKPTIKLKGRTVAWSGQLPAAGKLKIPYQAYSYQYTPPTLGKDVKEWRTHIVIHVSAKK